MEHEFWHERWQRGEIGFHRAEVHPVLKAQISALLPPPAGIFVPLCGKSLDMKWLCEQGYDVVGVELSAAAIEAFMQEQKLSYTRQQQGPFEVYQAEGIRIYHGDFFALQREHLVHCQAWYDRAALVALPPAMRGRYNQHLQSIMMPTAVGLVITVEYPDGYWKGPPFTVTEDEVRAAYSQRYDIDVLPARKGFIDGGDSQVQERGYRLFPRQSSAQ